MRNNIFYIALAALMTIACVEETFNNDINPMEGEEVVFSATSGNRVQTRTVYGDEVKVTDENGNVTGNQIVVNWVEGDNVKVWASEIASRNEAEYAVNTGGATQNFANSLDKTGSYGIQWGTEKSSDFCAIYPSENVVTPTEGSAFSKSDDGTITVRTKIDSIQNSVFVPITEYNTTKEKYDTTGWAGAHFGSDAVTPSMQSALMFARTNGAVPTDENGNPKSVDLHFKPYTTALKIKLAGYTSNLTNPTVYVQNIVIEAPVAIAGNFDLGITGTGTTASAEASSISTTTGEFSNTIKVNTILPGGTFLPLKPSQEVNINVFAIPQVYTLNSSNKLWKVTINTQGHGSFTYKMKPVADQNGNAQTYTFTAGDLHKIKIPNLQINSEIEWDPEKWITQIPVPVYISELSMPGTWYSTHSAYQNNTSLTDQYSAGIRAFNLDCRVSKTEQFNIFHSGVYENGDTDVYLASAGTEYVDAIAGRGMIREGTYILSQLQTLATLVNQHPEEYIVVVLTIAEKPFDDSGEIFGTVDPLYVIPQIVSVLNDDTVKAATYQNKITKDTTIDDVKGKMIIKINTNNDTINETIVNEDGTQTLKYQYPINSLVSFASMAMSGYISGGITNVTDATNYPNYYIEMQTSDMYWGNETTDLTYYYHQAQRTTSDDVTVSGVPTIAQRKQAIDNIIASSKTIYDNGYHNGWFQLGIGGYTKNYDTSNNSQTAISEELNPYVQGLIEAKMDKDPSPVGIVLMNHATTTDTEGKTVGIQLVKDIIEMNGKFYLNRLGGSIITGGSGDSSGESTENVSAQNAAYAVVGDDAFQTADEVERKERRFDFGSIIRSADDREGSEKDPPGFAVGIERDDIRRTDGKELDLNLKHTQMILFDLNRKFLTEAALCVAALTGTFFIAGCSVDGLTEPENQQQSQTITAYIEQPAATRACITTDIDGQTQVPVLWSPADALGVFTSSDNNVKYTNTTRLNNIEVATFATASTVTGTPECAYYPYSSAAGTDKTALSGTLPQSQKMNLVTGMIPGDYKIGEHVTTTSSGSQFRFTHLFSPIRIKIDGTGTSLANDRLIGIDLTVTRNNETVPVSGSFTFNATDGTYTLGTTSNAVTFDWATHPSLSAESLGYATVFPEIRNGDNLAFTIRTSAHTATLNVTAKVDFAPNTIYTFPLILSNYADSMTITERTSLTTGTFTAATYNVDGLGLAIVNSDGPGSSGTTSISQKIATKNWDIIGFSEDFSYHSELTSSLTSYTWGEHGGDYTDSSTDGLCFAVKSGISFSGGEQIAFTSSYGDLLSGANTNITKGFRHYEVTVAEGIIVDVIITHMNTYSSSGTDHINAQHAQLTQIAQYISGLTGNNRPIIFMGDTNCRYTRNDFQTNFWQYLADDQTISDPWVDYQWDGIYPTYGTDQKSLVVADATGTNADTDIIYSSQKGEVVDKIMYINDSGSTVQIYANGYNRDADFSGMADHWPIVVEFYYEKTTSTVAETQASVNAWADEELQ